MSLFAGVVDCFRSGKRVGSVPQPSCSEDTDCNSRRIHRREFITTSASTAGTVVLSPLAKAVDLLPDESLGIPSLVQDKSKETAILEMSHDALSHFMSALRNRAGIDTVKDASIHWNKLCAAFNVSGEVGIDLDNDKLEVLLAGMKTTVPNWVLEDTIFSVANYAKYLNTQAQTRAVLEKKQIMLQAVLPYFQKQGISNELVGFAVAQLLNQDDLNKTAQSYVDSVDVKYKQQVQNAFVYLYKNPHVRLSPQVLSSISQELESSVRSRRSNDSLASVSKSIAILANNGREEEALKFISQYFSNKPAQSAESDFDYDVLRTLVETAQKTKNQEKANAILLDLVQKHPNLFLNAYLGGNATTKNTAQAKAGREVNDLFNLNHEIGKKVLNTLLSNSQNDEIRVKVVQVIASLNSLSKETDFVSKLREIANNDFESDECRIAAIKGLGRIKDEASIKPLLKIATNPNNSSLLRGHALYELCLIDAPYLIPQTIEQHFNNDRPYGLELGYFNPVFDSNSRIKPWQPSESILSTNISDNDAAVYSITGFLDSTYGGSTGKLANLDLDLIQPLRQYVEECKEGNACQVDLNVLIPALYVLGRTKENSSILADIVRNPWSYAQNTRHNQVFQGATAINPNQTLLQVVGLQSLGSAVDISNRNDKGSEYLHTLLQSDRALIIYDETMLSLFQIACRYEDALKNGSPETREMKTAREKHILELMKYFISDASGEIDEPTKTYSLMNRRRSYTCNSLVKLKAEKELINLAFEKGWVKEGNEHLRTIVFALVINGYTAENISNIGLDPLREETFKKLFTDIKEDKCFFGDLISDNNLTGKDQQIAICDGGVSMFGSDVKNRLVTRFDTSHQKLGSSMYTAVSPHASTVCEQVFEKLPDVKIHLGTWDKDVVLSRNPFSSYDRFDPVIDFMTSILVGRLRGENNVCAIDLSNGVKSLGINARADHVNRRGAFGELATLCGINTFLSSGNDFGKPPVGSRNGDFGDVSANIAFMSDDHRFVQPNGVVRIGAYDAYIQRLIPTTGSLNHLHTPDISLVGVHGRTHYTTTRERGIRTYTLGGATSFAVPNLGVLYVALREMGIDVPPEEFARAVHGSTISLPGAALRGNPLSVEKLLKNLAH